MGYVHASYNIFSKIKMRHSISDFDTNRMLAIYFSNAAFEFFFQFTATS